MRILVGYATRTGSTRGVAEEIARTFERYGQQADAVDLRDDPWPGAYEAAVIGSAVHERRWLHEATQYLSRHREMLAGMPVAYFALCLTAVHGQPKTIEESEAYAAYPSKRIPAIRPVSATYFAGALDYADLPLAEQAFVRAFGVAEGDYRDWDAIRAWALEVAEKAGALQPVGV